MRSQRSLRVAWPAGRAVLPDLIEATTSYAGLFWLCALSGIIVPFPEDIPLLYAGILIESGRLAWAPTLGIALVGVLLRDLIAFAVGRWVGGWLLRRAFVQRLVGIERLSLATRMVRAHGARAVLAGRFFVGMRAPVFLVAGAMGTRTRQFLLWDAVGLIVAVPGMVLLGFGLGPPVVDQALSLMRSSRWAAGVLAIVVLAMLGWRALRAGRRGREASELELPPPSEGPPPP